MSGQRRETSNKLYHGDSLTMNERFFIPLYVMFIFLGVFNNHSFKSKHERIFFIKINVKLTKTARVYPPLNRPESSKSNNWIYKHIVVCRNVLCYMHEGIRCF